MNGNAKLILHEVIAGLLGIILSAGVVYCSINSIDIPDELSSSLAFVVGYFLRTSVS